MKVREAMAKTQTDLKRVSDEVADRVGRAAKELGTGAGHAARELTATAEESIGSQIRKQTKAARKRLPTRHGPSTWSVIAGAIGGAVTVYFFDPERGRARRAVFIDWSGARLRRGRRALVQVLKQTSESASTLPQRMVRLQTGSRRVDDLTLRDRVESEVFRSPELPKGQINLDVESRVVTLRGQMDNALQIARIEKTVLKVPGVRGVQNLLYVDGTPAPNKAEARAGN